MQYYAILIFAGPQSLPLHFVKRSLTPSQAPSQPLYSGKMDPHLANQHIHLAQILFQEWLYVQWVYSDFGGLLLGLWETRALELLRMAAGEHHDSLKFGVWGRALVGRVPA